MPIPEAKSSWAGPENSYENMSTVVDDEFSNFLDFENLEFNIPILDGNGYDATIGQDPSAQTGRFEDGNGDANGFAKFHQQPPAALPADNNHDQMQQHMSSAGVDHRDYGAYQQPGDAYQWPMNHPFPPNMSVPPTPNSSEMYPTRYLQQADTQVAYGGHHSGYDPKSAAMTAFTPLTSPQFTGSTHIPSYSIPGSHPLSPLTSPAMYPQSGSTQGSASVQSLTAESSLNGSPIDFDFETSGRDNPIDERPRKSRRKESSTKAEATGVSRRRKGSTVTRTTSKGTSRSRPFAETVRPSPANTSTRGEATSQVSSVSPPHQASISMRPPPKPASAKSTPALIPQQHITQNPSQPPATPASLMQLPNQPQSSSAGSTPAQSFPSSTAGGLGLGMEELTLPEAAAPSELPSRNVESRNSHSQPASVRGTPAILPRMSSSGQHYMQSPTPIPYGNTSKNPTGRGGSRKRNSTSSNLVSPALRPRISPNIQPLIPDGRQHPNVMTDETHALLLASKSNYQNILEGNHLPGVSYPSELSTNLTSKRTSHKIAEQGRRNRINTALQEMQSLLPTSPSIEGTSSGSNGESATPKPPVTAQQAANSKAATVEHAIDYIKELKTTTADKESEIEQLKADLAEMEKKLGQLRSVDLASAHSTPDASSAGAERPQVTAQKLKA